MSSQLVATLGGPEMLNGLRNGMAITRAAAGIPESEVVTAVSTEYIASGVYKSAHRMRVTFSSGGTIDMAIKKGQISLAEFSLMEDLGELRLMQKPLIDRLLEGDRTEAISIEEWVPGETYLDAFRANASLIARLNGAFGRYEAFVFMRTLNGLPGQVRALLNRDLHWQNIKMYESNGQMEARGLDFDPNYVGNVTPEQYWATTLARRKNAIKYGVFGEYNDYLAGVLEAFGSEPGSSEATGISAMRQAIDALRDPAKQTQYLTGYYPAESLSSAATGAADAIEAFLANR
jgi:hypothetical protein